VSILASVQVGVTDSGKSLSFVIPSEARNLSPIYAQEKKERFLASLGMTKGLGTFSET
jgi:hypothetical protein